MNVRRVAVTSLLVVGSFAPAAAAAQDYPGGTVPPGDVIGEQEERGEVLDTTVDRAPAAGVAATNQTLPVTGGDLVGLSIIGVALVGGGAVVVRRTRRRPVAA